MAPKRTGEAARKAAKSQALISIIDDDQSVREAVYSLIKSLGFAALAFASAPEFLASPDVDETACLIADVNMPRMTGIELHNLLRRRGHAIPTILITAYPNDDVRARALADGVICYLPKPFDEESLLSCLCSALKSRG